MNDEGKIVKFGSIFEDEDGNLNFDGFHIDAENRFESTAVAVMTLIKERLEREIEEFNKGLPSEPANNR